jgi:hypothetical protein
LIYIEGETVLKLIINSAWNADQHHMLKCDGEFASSRDKFGPGYLGLWVYRSLCRNRPRKSLKIGGTIPVSRSRVNLEKGSVLL